MELKYLFFTFLLINFSRVESASLLERSYEYVVNIGKSLAPNVLAILDCLSEEDPWLCSKEKAAKMLDSWEKENDAQRRSWKESADAEVISAGRSTSELPSAIGTEVEESLHSLSEIVQKGIAKATARKKQGGIDSITISTAPDKKKDKKKKGKPSKIHLIQAHPMFHQHKAKGRSFSQYGKSHVQSWVIGTEVTEPIATGSTRNAEDEESGEARELNAWNDKQDNGSTEGDVESHASTRNAEVKGVRGSRGLLDEAWAMGEKAIDAVAEHVVENENTENGLENDKSSLAEQRGKKKKKKKAILKLLILGAVLKAKIGSLLQILSFKLQVKFFLIALIGLGINLARFWLDLKKSHQQPQKVVYYEHASHQHHYDHEDEHGWGPWSRSIEPEEETDAEAPVSVQNTPYRAYDRNTQVFVRPTIS